MPNRILDKVELAKANLLLDRIRREIDELAGSDAELRFAYNRKVSKMLVYDKRKNPMARRKLKVQKRRDQNGLYAICLEALPEKYAVIDRLETAAGYIAENTRLICEPCDRKVQVERGYK